MINSDNPELQLAFDFVEQTGLNIFLTGKAGTGKTTFLHELRKKSPKRMIVVAPTGVAAINAGGVTIHSFFQLPFGPHLPGRATSGGIGAPPQVVNRFNRTKIGIIRSLDLLVIDEISMVRADLLDAVDEVLRRFRDRDKPFGGVQLLMIGDLQQLAPVVKDDEWDVLKEQYETIFFFGSQALAQTQQVTVELQHIYRQSDPVFIDLLNRVRENTLDSDSLAELNKRHMPGFARARDDGFITLTTHNYQSAKINTTALQTLPGKAHTFGATVEGEFPDYSYPTDLELMLKPGAQVMFVKNDASPEKLYYNGKIGVVDSITDDAVLVRCAGDDLPLSVGPVAWQNTRYVLDEATKEIRESVAGTFTQYPLKLAWAITIHKSQGLTFEKVVIDAASAFAHGQVYVALSRCKTLEGMVLSTPLSLRCIKSDGAVSRFVRSVEENRPSPQRLHEAKHAYQKMLINDLFDFTTVERQLWYCVKLGREHGQSFVAGFREGLEAAGAAIRKECAEVSGHFGIELERLIEQNRSIEDNAPLQLRVTKACGYFLQKVEAIKAGGAIHPEVETDNKTVFKLMNNALLRLHDLLETKRDCFKACLSGFTVKKYQEARLLAAIQKPKKESRRASAPEDTYSGLSPHPELLGQLKAWRNAQAEESGMPHYMVLQQKTMQELAAKLPSETTGLLKIKGIGRRKAERYGPQILALINSYTKEKNIAVAAAGGPPAEPAPKQEKTPTRQVTWDYFMSNKSISDIAALRGLTESTIAGHLAHYVAAGDLAIERLVAPEKIARIQSYFEAHEPRLTPAKEALGEDVSYGDLRLVLGHMQQAHAVEKSPMA